MRDVGRQSLFYIILSFLCLLHAGLSAHAQDKAAEKSLDYLQYHQAAARIDVSAHTVDLDKFLALRKQKGTVVLDLRDKTQYDQGHVEGAVQFGADISKEKLEKFVPSKDSTILIYCSYSLMPARMISLTDASLAQFILQGYTHTYKLAPIWEGKSNWQDTETAMKRLPMVTTGKSR